MSLHTNVPGARAQEHRCNRMPCDKHIVVMKFSYWAILEDVFGSLYNEPKVVLDHINGCPYCVNWLPDPDPEQKGQTASESV